MDSWIRFLRRPAHRWASGLLLFLLLMAFLGPVASPWKPDQTSDHPFSSPGSEHWMGTDLHGRDLFVRLAAATRLSLGIGLAGSILSVGLGAVWGMGAGLAGRRGDFLLMRIVDGIQAIPSVVLVLLALNLTEVAAARGTLGMERIPDGLRRILVLVLVIGGVSWPTLSRVVRAQVLTLKERPFVLASRSIGAGTARILLRHLLPNLTGILLVNLTLSLPAVLLQESFLSVLGLGIRPPEASLGTLIAEGAAQLNPIRVRLWLLAFPAVALITLLWSFGRLADGLRETWDREESGLETGATPTRRDLG